MRIAVVGAGALGSFISAKLSQGHEVTLIAREWQVKTIKEKGLRITGYTNITSCPAVVSNSQHLEEQDLVILAVKSYQTGDAVKDHLSLIKKSCVLSLQNGLDNEEKIGAIIGKERVIGGVTSHGLTLIAQGEVRHAGLGETVIGELNNEITERVEKISNALNASGIETRITDNIQGEIWAKAIVNACINPITALAGVKNGLILKIPELRVLMELVYRECIAVAEAKKVLLPGCNLLDKVIRTAQLTSDNFSSMLQDVMKKRRTEIESINGALVRLGAEENVEMPVNSALVCLVKGLEKGFKCQ